MLRMYLHETRSSDRLTLEGELTGAWVGELALCCDTLLSGSPGRSLLLDVSQLRAADQGGQQLLKGLKAAGVAITGRPENAAAREDQMVSPTIRPSLWHRLASCFHRRATQHSHRSESILPGRLVL